MFLGRRVERWGVALVGATALHAGFQLTVSAVVYPALSELAPADWKRAHAAHSRRISSLVGLVYPAVATAAVGRLRAAPDGPALLATACSAMAVALTAGVAAPLHGRLAGGHDPVLVRRLLLADRGRSALALAALVAAVAAVRP